MLVSEVETVVLDRLKARARTSGRALGAEPRVILRQAVGLDMDVALRELQRIQADFEGRTFSGSTELLRADRGR